LFHGILRVYSIKYLSTVRWYRSSYFCDWALSIWFTFITPPL